MTWSGTPASSVTLGGRPFIIRAISNIVFTNEGANVDVTGVELNKTSTTLTVGGDAVALTATVKPDDATDKKVKWSVGGTDSGAVTLYSDATCDTPVELDKPPKP